MLTQILSVLTVSHWTISCIVYNNVENVSFLHKAKFNVMSGPYTLHYTDSLSSLLSKGNIYSAHPIIIKIFSQLYQLQHKRFTMLWLNDHVGISQSTGHTVKKQIQDLVQIQCSPQNSTLYFLTNLASTSKDDITLCTDPLSFFLSKGNIYSTHSIIIKIFSQVYQLQHKQVSMLWLPGHVEISRTDVDIKEQKQQEGIHQTWKKWVTLTCLT